MGKRLTLEQVKQYIEVDSNSGCKLLSKEYINSDVKLEIQCKCTNVFNVEYTKFFSQNKRQCNNCTGINSSNRQRKTHVQFIQEVFDLVKDEYTILSEYVKTMTHVSIRHNICEHEYKVSPSNFLRGKRCPKCNGGVSRSHEEFARLLNEKYDTKYIMLSDYKRATQKIKVQHVSCGFIYDVFPQSILDHESDCPWCSGYYQDTNRFKDWILENCDGEYELISEYDKATKKVKIEHIKCGHIFNMTPNHFKTGERCPKCKSSKGEIAIEKYLKTNNINYLWQYRIPECKNKKPLPFDFAIRDDKDEILFLLEFQGRQHFEQVYSRRGNKYSTLEYIQHNDQIKRDFCKANNILLLEISYIDIKNVELIIENYISELRNYLPIVNKNNLSEVI